LLFSAKHAVRLFTLCLAGCGAGSDQPALTGQQTTAAALAVLEAAARDCPWPANAAQFDGTTLVARHARAPSPDLGVLNSMHSGCAILTFTVDDQGIVATTNLVAEHPAGFGRIASHILRWNDYASGTPLSPFMVRLGAEQLPNGGALVSLGFKDTSINLVVPPGG